jgi:microcystin-dependent protein
MASKKYVVRDGFVVFLKVISSKGDVSERTYTGGEEVTLDDSDAADHLHKLEFSSEKDRAAALAAEKAANVTAMAGNDPSALVQALVAALAQAQGVAPAAAAPQVPAP